MLKTYFISPVQGERDELHRSPGTPVYTAPECCTGRLLKLQFSISLPTPNFFGIVCGTPSFSLYATNATYMALIHICCYICIRYAVVSITCGVLRLVLGSCHQGNKPYLCHDSATILFCATMSVVVCRFQTSDVHYTYTVATKVVQTVTWHKYGLLLYLVVVYTSN